VCCRRNFSIIDGGNFGVLPKLLCSVSKSVWSRCIVLVRFEVDGVFEVSVLFCCWWVDNVWVIWVVVFLMFLCCFFYVCWMVLSSWVNDGICGCGCVG